MEHPVVIVPRVVHLTKLVFENSWLPSVLKRPKEWLLLYFAHMSRYQQLQGKKRAMIYNFEVLTDINPLDRSI